MYPKTLKKSQKREKASAIVVIVVVVVVVVFVVVVVWLVPQDQLEDAAEAVSRGGYGLSQFLYHLQRLYTTIKEEAASKFYLTERVRGLAAAASKRGCAHVIITRPWHKIIHQTPGQLGKRTP
jgi:flagellar basal body-associated protein FliL